MRRSAASVSPKASTIGGQLTKQVIGVLATVVYCGIASFIILKVIDVVIGLRVVDEDEEADSTSRCTTNKATTSPDLLRFNTPGGSVLDRLAFFRFAPTVLQRRDPAISRFEQRSTTYVFVSDPGS